jgi:hypothetical protein
MKKVRNILSFIIVIFLLTSCATSKEARNYKKTIDGDWQLQSITTEGITGKINVELFNEENLDCFVESNWTFNDANSLGSYTISKNGNKCVAVKRNIRWSIYEANKNEPKQFQFKRLDDKLKVMDNGDGFRFTIVQADNNTMQLKSSITFENKPAWVVYNFVKK